MDVQAHVCAELKQQILNLSMNAWRSFRLLNILRLVTNGPCDDHAVAKAAVNAVLNRWGDGPDTPSGVRARLRRSGPGAAALAGRLTDEQVRVATAGVRRLYRDWAALPVGGTLRATWPLHDSWLHLL